MDSPRVPLLLCPADALNADLHGKVVIVVDVLRATTTLTTALEHGWKGLAAVASREEALAFQAAWTGPEKLLLCGEEQSLTIKGFDLGNSPLEYRAQPPGSKGVLTTSNGTKALLAAQEAQVILAGCLRNRNAVAQAALDYDSPVVVLLSGRYGKPAEDDMIAGGAILEALSFPPEGEAAERCLHLYHVWKRDLFHGLASTPHGQSLLSLGFEEDVRFCASLDCSDIVPMWQEGWMVPR